MKKLFYLLLTLTLCLACAMPVLAQTNGAAGGQGTQVQQPRLVDDADILTSEDEADVLNQLNEISQRQKMDVVVVTVNALGGKTATAYADDFYDYNGYGYGTSKDGILLLISMEANDWAISTTGKGIPAFTDAGQAYIMEQVLPSLSSQDYYFAFSDFASLCDDFLTQAATGSPYDTGNMPKGKLGVINVLISLVGGLIIGGIVILVMRSSLKSVRLQPGAENYVKDGSMNVTGGRETFLYRNVITTVREKQDSGSSTHTGSSGTTHGGSSGKF
ncbi:MAG: TPM domain-containing protein [Anaerovoracaceae bacterium]